MKFEKLLEEAVQENRTYQSDKIFLLNESFLAKKYHITNHYYARKGMRISNAMYENGIQTAYSHDIIRLEHNNDTFEYVIMDFIHGQMFWELPEDGIITALRASKQELIKTLEMGIVPRDSNWSNRIWTPDKKAYQIDVDHYDFGTTELVKTKLKEYKSDEYIQGELEDSKFNIALGRMMQRGPKRKRA